MTEAKILYCEKCNATGTGIGGSTDSGTRVITIIEATDELDGNNAVMSSNAIFGGNDKRIKRGVEAASLAGNETRKPPSSLDDEMAREDLPDVPKTVPTKRGADVDMTQAIMEQRVDYDVNDEFMAANGHGYDAPRTKPVRNYQGYRMIQDHRSDPDDLDEHLEDAEADDFDDGDHNSHYEYVPMEFDNEGNHR